MTGILRNNFPKTSQQLLALLASTAILISFCIISHPIMTINIIHNDDLLNWTPSNTLVEVSFPGSQLDGEQNTMKRYTYTLRDIK